MISQKNPKINTKIRKSAFFISFLKLQTIFRAHCALFSQFTLHFSVNLLYTFQWNHTSSGSISSCTVPFSSRNSFTDLLFVPNLLDHKNTLLRKSSNHLSIFITNRQLILHMDTVSFCLNLFLCQRIEAFLFILLIPQSNTAFLPERKIIVVYPS